MIASIPAMDSFPKMVDATSAWSVSDSPPMLSLRLSITPPRVFILPSLSVRLIPYSSMYFAISFVGEAIFAMDVFRAVPLMDPFSPALAIRPAAMDTSSMLYPMAPATGATYLKVSPINPTLVLELADACASTSAKCPASPAFSPKAVSASVTISDVFPMLSPDAAAKFIIPSMPSIICPGSQPAIAM